ncbi:MAG: T9SS type A sorting domain-containing protein, partial [Cyclobacteriaceae bacterium]|nr:T9SS type A sorting domain-containing protein [Cyclobacteriaceae bacterium]
YYLKDYYAYDDGTAEKGAGVNSAGNEIAYQFPFLGSIESSLIGIDAYFPQAVGNTQHGEQVKIKIWSHANEGPDKVLYSRFLTIPRIDSLNHFIRIPFYNPIELTDTFYIGWEQLNSQRVFIGLDKNINSQDKIWLNTSGFWEPNNNQIVGSLMMRPYFKDTIIATSVNDINIPTVKIYPNPSSRFFKFEIENNISFKILNLSGQEVQPIYRKEDTTVILDFELLPSGVYIIKFIDNNSIYMERILLTNLSSDK